MNFINYVRSSNPLLLVRTYEEFRAINRYAVALDAVRKKGSNCSVYKTYVWSLHGGVRVVEINDGKARIGKDAVEGTAKNPMAALDWLEKAPDNTVLFLRDFHPYLTKEYDKSVTIIAKIRDLVRPFNAQNKAMVFISPSMQIPSDLEKDITPVEFKLPDKAELLVVLKGVCLATNALMPKEADVDTILDAALGMTSTEAENAFSLSLVEAKKFDEALIRREKAVTVKKSGILEVIETQESLDSIGGLENAKAWALIKKECFTPEARAFGASSPKGILLMGIAGCGKSLLAKALSTAFGRPLLRLDFSNIMDKWVGGSEGKMKLCLETAEAVSPCILWIDEIEKGLAGNSGGGQEGHEVTRRIFGMLLTWVEEKKKDVILVATANNINSLPPELISRFPVSFWVDLPDAVQRKAIIQIHLKKRSRSPNLFSDDTLAEVIRLSEHFSGRELEAAVQDSIDRAWHNKHPQVQIEDLIEAVKAITPVSKVKKAELDSLREQARNMGTKPASIVHEVASTSQGQRKINLGAE